MTVPVVTRGVRRERRRSRTLAPVIALVLAAAAGCGGGGGEGGPSLSALPSRTSSATLPSPTLSLPTATRTGIGPPTTAQPTTAQPTTAQPTTAQPTTAQPTTAQPTPTSTEEAADQTSRPAESPSSVAAGTPTAEGVAEAQPDSTTTGWIVLVVLVALAAATTAFVVALRHRSARRRWTTTFDASVAESRQLTRDLVPSLLEASRESRRGGWQVARADVVAVEDRFADLARSAPDQDSSATARGLAEAVGDLRQRLDDEVRATAEQAGAALENARDASRRLADRLSVLASATDPGPT